MKENPILDKTFEFALSTIGLYKFMVEKNEYVLSKQVLRSGTSIGANVEEAIAAISKGEFIAKMSIANKEARETRYWLRLLEKSELVKIDVNRELKEVTDIVNILTKIIKTSQDNLENKN